MKHILITLFCIISLITNSQTCTLAYDYMEVYTWFGNWNTIINTGFYNNASVSPTLSGVLYGSGSGSSIIESANYVLPNVIGLNTTYAHKLSFRLASYRFSNPTAATAGVDGPDYIDVRYSTNGGTTYTTEMRIAGNSNAYWNYNTAATASKTATGVMTTYAPSAGGDRTATGDGYSIIELTIPAGATQLAFILNSRVNSAGEEWWIDNVELIQLGPCAVLPIELVSFDGANNGEGNVLTWITATELNNSHFNLDRSIDGYNWIHIASVNGSGTTNTPSFYTFTDYETLNGIIYYRLSQIDYDGHIEIFNIIFIDLSKHTKICKYTYYNTLGKEVDISEITTGIYIRVCEDGMAEKIYIQK